MELIFPGEGGKVTLAYTVSASLVGGGKDFWCSCFCFKKEREQGKLYFFDGNVDPCLHSPETA
jgi:hypothetical protein